MSAACFFTDGPSDVALSTPVDDALLFTHLQMQQITSTNSHRLTLNNSLTLGWQILEAISVVTLVLTRCLFCGLIDWAWFYVSTNTV